MATEIVGTDEFRDWFWALSVNEQRKVALIVDMLAEQGIALGFPYSSQIKGSKHAGMRELRTSHAGDRYRVLYIFDPLRNAVLLVGGTKTGTGNAGMELQSVSQTGSTKNISWMKRRAERTQADENSQVGRHCKAELHS